MMSLIATAERRQRIRRPLKRTTLAATMCLATIASAFWWPMVATGPLTGRGLNATLIVWSGYADLMVHGLNGRHAQSMTSRTVRVVPAARKGYRLPAYWFERDRAAGSLRIQVPLFIPTGACVAWAGWGWIRARSRARRDECGSCGYSMTGIGTPVCPECGASRSARGAQGGRGDRAG